MTEKKAQAQIIVTVLIILIVIAAVGIVAVLVMNMIRERAGTAEQQLACLDIQLSVARTIESESSVSVKREAGGGNITDIIVMITGKELGETVANGTLVGGITELATKLVDLKVIDNQTVNYILVSGDLVEIIPILEGNINCNVKASTTVA